MFYFLLILLIINGFVLAAVVLLQAGKGGGLASMGGGTGTDTLIGGRQAATLLTKATWVSGGLFLTLSLILSLMSTASRTPESILRDEFRQGAPVSPAPVLPGAQPQTPAPGATAPQQNAPAPTTTR